MNLILSFRIPVIKRCILFTVLAFFSSPAFAVSVKFSVDMSNYITLDLYNPANKVYLRGSFNNWEPIQEVVKQPGSNVYTTTLSLEAGKTYNYKFYFEGSVLCDGYEGVVGNGKNGNRILAVGASSLTLPVVYFNNYQIDPVVVSKEKAQTIAQNWYKHWNPDRSASTEILDYTFEYVQGQPAYHIFNFVSGGWVVVSAVQRVKPIIAYNFYYKAHNLGVWIYDSFMSEVPDAETQRQWDEIFRNDFSRYNSKQVMPLVTSHWHQDWPYNAYYPLNPVYFPEENGHYRLGCTITAAAQMMKYWNYPESGKGIVNCENDPVTGLDYHDLSNDHFQWYNMPDFLPVDTSLTEDVYGPSALVSYSFWITLQNLAGELYSNWISSWSRYFGYSPSAELIQRISYTHEEWKAFYNNELDNGRPIMMSGSGDVGGQGGHAFICDGYQADEYYHVNLGWADINGYLDGFYPLDNMAAHFLNKTAMINFQPEYLKPDYRQEYQPDDHTILLMHFNGDLSNSVESGESGRAMGAGISYADNSANSLGECLKIDNSTADKSSFLSVKHYDALNLSGDWTIEAWVYVNSWDKNFNRDPFLFMKRNDDWSSINFNIKLLTDNKNALYEYRSPQGSLTSFDAQPYFLETGKWYHMAFIRNSATRNLKLLVHDANNEVVYYRSQPYNSDAEQAPGINNGDLIIGSSGEIGWGLFDGYIDELRISNVARTIDEEASVVYAPTYPGDADNDGQVKAADVLPLAFFYGETGEPRGAALLGCSWQLDNRIPWENYRATFADCNGDGVVNNDDILCIGYNYNKISSSYQSRSMLKSASLAILQVNCQPDLSTLKPGDSFNLVFSIENGCELAGTSLAVNWDTSIVEMDKQNYFTVGDVWQDNPLIVKQLDADNGLFEIGISNLNGKTITSDGELFRLKATLKNNEVSMPSVSEAIGMDENGETVTLSVSAFQNATGIKETGGSVSQLKCYPNPTSGITMFEFSVSENQNCSLQIYNAQGKVVNQIVADDEFDAGTYSFEWNAAQHPKGIYLCKLEIGKTVFTQKLNVK